MSHLIPLEITQFLKTQTIATDIARKVLRQAIKGENIDGDLESSLYLVFQALLVNNPSKSKISEILTSIKLGEEFISEILQSWDDIPKPRYGVVFPQLVDVNWKSSHVISTSEEKRIHLPSLSVNLNIQEASGEFSSLSFTCNREQLADLTYKLKSALLQVERFK
ncbi:unnamed protein product [Blepharisma stoltei]|uniref:COMM domain-containing protein 3 n=1 Tax=Blepharisma stoltei TaxID=1481888 RepID=A0AAU9IJ38_9CILI|nr:unnamed protein product [Blepharisma stoltei]